ncbi:MAG: HEAT repeat domain-containing protein, partial [Myxococcota bacterium]
RYGRDVQPLLERGLLDDNVEIRTISLRSMSKARLWKSSSLSVLKKLMKHKVAKVRFGAVMALLTLGKEAEPVMNDLRRLLEDPNIQVRKAVLQVFLELQNRKRDTSKKKALSKHQQAQKNTLSVQTPATKKNLPLQHVKSQK